MFQTRRIPFFTHPIPLLAVLIVFINDHFLKTQFHNFYTGKMSDLFGVFFFPLFLIAFSQLLFQFPSRLTRTHLLFAILITDCIFSGVNLVPRIADIYVWLVGYLGFPSKVTMDITDLYVMPISNLGTYLFARVHLSKMIEQENASLS